LTVSIHVLCGAGICSCAALGLNTLLQGFPTNNAWALCTFAYSAGPGTEPILFEGRVDGKIVPPRGQGKFGWNPVFEVSGTGKTCGLP
jgi:inosine triphosphate pyrophosphatase